MGIYFHEIPTLYLNATWGEEKREGVEGYRTMAFFFLNLNITHFWLRAIESERYVLTTIQKEFVFFFVNKKYNFNFFQCKNNKKVGGGMKQNR